MSTHEVPAALLAIETNSPTANALNLIGEPPRDSGAFCVRVRGALKNEASIEIALGKVNDPAPPAAGPGRVAAFP